MPPLRAAAERVLAAYAPGHEWGDMGFGPIASGLITHQLTKEIESLRKAIDMDRRVSVVVHDEGTDLLLTAIQKIEAEMESEG